MIWALLIGLVVGAIAKFIVPGKDPGGILLTMLIGVAGSMLAYGIGSGTGHYSSGQPVGILASILGAVVILLLYRVVVRKRI